MYEKVLPYKIKNTLGFVFDYLDGTKLYSLFGIYVSCIIHQYASTGLQLTATMVYYNRRSLI